MKTYTSDIHGLTPALPQGPSKRDDVRRVFSDVAHYVAGRGVDIRVRKDIVSTFAQTLDWHTALDIGCGDGSISLPLARPDAELTLMDLSPAMTARALESIPDPLRPYVHVQNDDFQSTEFHGKTYDLIVTVGVIAHVDSPDAFLAKIKALLTPGGALILEFTDAMHPVGRLGRFWGALKECVAPASYRTNRLSAARVLGLLEKHGFSLVSQFRYGRVPLPAVDRTLGQDLHYRLVRRVFGEGLRNRHASWGNEYICLLRN